MDKLTRIAALALTVSLFSCDFPAPVPVYAVANRGADSDGDGIADIDDACATEPEDGLPPKANDGCPADDPDQDGIASAEDRCPYAKEDGQPPNPNDGCPSNDADGDGVADARDKCPKDPEDNLPPDPGDGCPSPDRDRDGIADSIDQCVADKETWNGYRDEDGCPDELPARQTVAFDQDHAEIYVPEARKIEFETDSATLTQPDRATLGDVACVLKAHPEVSRVEVEGHASSKGDPKHNLDLTEKRATSVVRALGELGVDPHRLVPIGYGEYCPAVPVGDEVDEPRNRRVLFKTVVINGVWQTVRRGCWRAQTTAGADPTKRKQSGKPMVIPASGGL